ncbi:MAG: hypothetical protein OEZ08_05040 [Betaproteobacteria bacterium]|nr:hypothetical protein [Betaproteobacteria bacterium]
MSQHTTAWQCIGCGRIEGPQPCIGVCEDRRVDLVNASDYDKLSARLARERERTEALAALVRQLAGTTPREGGWEQSYRALQTRAHTLLASLGSGRRPDRQ